MAKNIDLDLLLLFINALPLTFWVGFFICPAVVLILGVIGEADDYDKYGA